MMFALRRLLILLVIVLAAYCFWPRNSSLKNFEPARISELQIQVWKEATAKNRTGTIAPLFELYSGQYRLAPITSLMIAFDMARALHIFATAPDLADQEKAILPLRMAYVNLKKGTNGTFDPDAVARMELSTWMLQSDHAKRGELTASIADRLAVLYELDPAQCIPVAKRFAQARKNVTDNLWSDAQRESLAGWTTLKELLSTPEP
jgi:hypothetical protein